MRVRHTDSDTAPPRATRSRTMPHSAGGTSQLTVSSITHTPYTTLSRLSPSRDTNLAVSAISYLRPGARCLYPPWHCIARAGTSRARMPGMFVPRCHCPNINVALHACASHANHHANPVAKHHAQQQLHDRRWHPRRTKRSRSTSSRCWDRPVWTHGCSSNCCSC